MTELSLKATLAPSLPPRPYPGLRPFEMDDWPIFFGRESMVDELVDLLAPKCLDVRFRGLNHIKRLC
jgi:hypothetical protein